LKNSVKVSAELDAHLCKLEKYSAIGPEPRIWVEALTWLKSGPGTSMKR